METVRFRVQYDLPAPPERVWPILSDTERLNRTIGLPPTRPHAIGGEPVRRARVAARLHGIPLVWEEDPFEFVEPCYYWVRRAFAAGPIRQFNGGARLTPTDAGTRAEIEAEFVPAGLLGQAAARVLCAKARRDWDLFIAGVREHLAGRREPAFGPGVESAAPALSRQTAARLQSADEALRREPLAPRLFEFLAGAGDLDLQRVRPFVLARQWGADRLEVLRLCLRAAHVGVLDLSWDLMCPNCRGARSRWRRLEEVGDRSHCDDCQITFDANFDRAVEVTFRPNARIRTVDGTLYCSGGPQNTPHVLAQKTVDPGTEAEIRIPLRAGRYRLRNLTADLAVRLVCAEEAGSSGLTAYFDEDVLQAIPGDLPLRAGEVALRFVNRTQSRQQVLIERTALDVDAATAAQVSVFQEFRELFGKELLAPDVQLGIRTLPLLFTDLQGSTALYSRLGDASAYALVRDHFLLLQTVVARHGGGLVKTIGDAVMAAFPDAAAAVACALEIHADLDRFNQTARQPLRVKVGLHQGPCIAVRSYDERLDYFGGTVNLAARTHEQSRGDDVVITEAILRDPEAAALLVGIRQETFVADLRGLGQVPLIRLLP